MRFTSVLNDLLKYCLPDRKYFFCIKGVIILTSKQTAIKNSITITVYQSHCSEAIAGQKLRKPNTFVLKAYSLNSTIGNFSDRKTKAPQELLILRAWSRYLEKLVQQERQKKTRSGSKNKTKSWVEPSLAMARILWVIAALSLVSLTLSITNGQSWDLSQCVTLYLNALSILF